MMPALKVNPGAGGPDKAKLYPVPCGCGNPPVTMMGCEYAVPTMPEGRGDGVVMASAEATMSENVPDTWTGGWPLGTAAVTEIVNVPAEVGVPLKTPELLSVNPAGGAEEDHENVPPPLIAVKAVA
jgi:hypothetical protein